MSYSFLIHAGDDKGRLAPIVRSLLDMGVKLWIDDPYHVELRLRRSDIRRLAGYIRPGKAWTRQRDIALQNASAVLLAVSEASLQPSRSQVRAELAIAEFRELDEGIPVFPMALSAAELSSSAALIGRRQSFKTFVELEGLDYVLTEQGRRSVEEVADALQARPATVRRPRKSESPRLECASPYFADRRAQVQDLSAALRRRRGTDRLLLPVTIGRYEDRPDKFALEQVPARLVPQVSRVRGCQSINVPWPYCAKSGPARALELLHYELEDVMPLQHPAVVYTQPPPEELRNVPEVLAALALWCQLWSSEKYQVSRDLVLPVIDLRTEQLKPSGGFSALSLMLLKKRVEFEDPLRRGMAQLEQSYSDVELVCLPSMQHVSWDCVEEWLRDDVGPMLGEHRTAIYRDLLRRYFKAEGMVMESWARRAHDVFAGLHTLGR